MLLKKIQVVCPSNAITGGPESLHNLASLLGSIGETAEIVYHPFSTSGNPPEEYIHYGVNSGLISDEQGVLVILPEVLCFEAKRFSRSVVAIWWLSLDNFRERKYNNWRDTFRYVKKCLSGQRPWTGARALKKYLHFSKSFYDLIYLQECKISPFKLTGPIAVGYVREIKRIDPTVCRRNHILFNPKKGKRVIERLAACCPEFVFTPLADYDQTELISRYRESKLYVDFGHHPGRERMPREAVACGCCLITGVLGSAKNSIDIPIPEKFKLNDQDKFFTDRFRSVVKYVFDSFPTATRELDAYRFEIENELDQQRVDLEHILRALRSKS
jgi:hypothetical protein